MNRKVLGVVAGVAGSLAWDLFKRLSTRHNRGIARGKRFVILGGGFAGVEAGRELERLLPGEDNGQIILVDQHDYLLFTPMLTEAVGGGIEPHHIIVPLKSFIERTEIAIGKVDKIDLEARTVSVGGPNPRQLTADHLIIALGATSNFHHAPGVEDSAITMKSLDDARRVRDAALGFVKSAARETDASARAAMLTFLVAGGGYTGVETIAALNDFVRDTAAEYESLARAEIRMIIVEPMERLMSEVTEDLAAYTKQELEKAGVRVLLKTGIKSADGDKVTLTNGEEISVKTFVWTAGVEANELVAALDAPKGKSKGLKVSPELALKKFQGVWVVGDSAEIPCSDGPDTYGATAQNATREGKLVAQNIVRQLRGQAQKPFTYTPIGQLALVGRRRGVARIYGHNFSGFVAYLLWRGVYLAKLPSMTQRLRVLSDWLLDAVLGPVAWVHYASAPPQRENVKQQAKRQSASA